MIILFPTSILSPIYSAVIFCIMLLKITVNLLYYYKHINKHTTIILFLDKEEFKKNNPIIKTIIISSIFTFIYF